MTSRPPFLRRRPLAVLLFVCILGVGASCGDGYGATEPTVAVTGIKVTPQVMQLTAIGQSQQITGTITPANATDRSIIWESTDTTVAKVDATGKVTAKAAGLGVFITAYSHDRQFQASVNVSVVP
jgi:uncharacterized protein YjdB